MQDATLSIAIDLVRDAAHPLTGSAADYDSLLINRGCRQQRQGSADLPVRGLCALILAVPEIVTLRARLRLTAPQIP